MSKKRGSRQGSGVRKKQGPPLAISLAKSQDGTAWVLVHPRCAVDRFDDVAEARAMIEGGEGAVARDELLWLLEGCPDLLAAHRLLGELALQLDNDFALARGHFGHAFQLGLRALRRNKKAKQLPQRLPANRDFWEAGKGLVGCLMELDKKDMAKEVLEKLRELDVSDPLGCAAALDDLATGGLPTLTLGLQLKPEE